MMIAKYELRSFSGGEQVWVGKYRNLRNLPHWHNECELIAVGEGKARVTISNGAYDLTQGESIFCPGGSIHSIESDGLTVLYVGLFDSSLFSRVLQTEHLVTPVIPDYYAAVERLNVVRRELAEQRKCYVEKTAAYIMLLMGDIFRGEPTQPCTAQITKEKSAFRALLTRIDEQFEYIDFEQAASFMGYSPSYFSRYFSSVAGMTFSEYLNNVRIEKAIEMLRDPEQDIPITEVAIRCGFNTIRNFNRVFKKITGSTPRRLPQSYTGSLVQPKAAVCFDPTLADSELID